MSFSPHGCIATRALGAAGWDGRHISLVMSFDLPTDLISVVQEKGRAGHYPGASLGDNRYEVCVTLASYTYLLRRIHRSSDNPDPVLTRCNVDYVPVSSSDFIALDAYQTKQEQDLFEILGFLIMPNECQHCILERKLSNPFLSQEGRTVTLPPCQNACSYCVGDLTRQLPRIVVRNMQRALVELFIGPESTDRLILDDTLVDALQDYPNAQDAFFDSKAKGKEPTAKSIKTALILLLVAAGIITYKVDYWSIKKLPSKGKCLKPNCKTKLFMKANTYFSQLHSTWISLTSVVLFRRSWQTALGWRCLR